MNERFELAPNKRALAGWQMPCLNYIVTSLRCTQCLKYATHICGISFPVWLAVFGVSIPKRDAHIYIYIYIYIYIRSENSVTIMCLALRRSAIIPSYLQSC